MKYPSAVARLMEVEGKEIVLPTLSSNPFSTLPLESSQSHLLVGRVQLKTALQQYIRFMSSRRILLSGEMGSGRSSLLRCLANHAPESVHIDHISFQNPALGLLREVYFQLTGDEGPSGWSQVVDKLVDASRAYKHSLPLIVIDAQGVEMNLLSQALSSASSSLNRIQCVLVVVLETRQKAQFPEKLLHMFDSEHHLEPFTIDEIQALVETRIHSVSEQEFQLSVEDARHLLSKTYGNPGAIIKTLRNAVDAARNPSSLAGINKILRSPSPMPQAPEEPVEVTPAEQRTIVPEEHEASAQGDVVVDENKPFGTLIDASAPWTEREELRDIQDDVKIMDSMDGFELDLEQLDEEKSTDAELPEMPFKALPQTPEYVPILDDSGPPQIGGMFSSIVGRIRDVKNSPMPPEETGAELWVGEGGDPVPALDPEASDNGFPDVPEGASFAELIHDEIGFYEEEVNDDKYEVAPNQYTEEETAPSHPSAPGEVLALTKAVQALVNALSSNEAGPTNATSQRAFIDALAALQNKPIINHEEHHLDIGLLSALNANEMAVLAVAKHRKFSPSDRTLLEDLGVKRSRLSQICNRLLKGGVLNVRATGRSRYYTMTSTAKAQLVAWGIEGGEA